MGAHTAIDICYYNLGALVGKKPSCLRADTLARTSNDGHLASKKTGWVVEVLVNLGKTIGRCHFDVMFC